jgi:hypothetical protein
MKKNCISLIILLIIFSVSSTAIFAAGLSANRILNPGFNQDSWWGGGLVLTYEWNRTPVDNAYCRTTTEGNNSDGAIWVHSSPSQITTGWTSGLRVVVKPSATYTCNVWAKWDNCSVADGIQMNVIVYDNNLNPNILGTFVPCATTGTSSGNWVKLTGSFNAPADGACADVFLGTIGANTEAWVIFDNVKMQTPDDPNLLINSGFETYDNSGYAGQPSYWRRNTSGTKAGFTSSTFNTGTACTFIRITADAGYKMQYNAQLATRSYVSIDPTKTYLYGGWMTWSFITSGAAGIGIQWFDGQGTTLNNDIATTGFGADLLRPPNSSIIVTNDNLAWTYMTATATPPAGAIWARFILWNASTAVQPTGFDPVIWYDDVVFKDILPVVVVTPSPLNISLGNTQIFGANGGTAPYTWMSSDTAVGSIDANSGLFTALSIGSTTITATDDDGFTATAIANVVSTRAPIMVEPQSVIIQRSIQFGELYE